MNLRRDAAVSSRFVPPGPPQFPPLAASPPTASPKHCATLTATSTVCSHDCFALNSSAHTFSRSHAMKLPFTHPDAAVLLH
eukprot:4513125-Pleurochrysis_carterae.AAC.1